MATFGSAGSINYPDKKALSEGHSVRSTCGSTRHSSLGDHKSLEAEALAEVRAGRRQARPLTPPEGQGWAPADGGVTSPFTPGQAKPGHRIDSELASRAPAGLPLGGEAGWV